MGMCGEQNGIKHIHANVCLMDGRALVGQKACFHKIGICGHFIYSGIDDQIHESQKRLSIQDREERFFRLNGLVNLSGDSCTKFTQGRNQ